MVVLLVSAQRLSRVSIGVSDTVALVAEVGLVVLVAIVTVLVVSWVDSGVVCRAVASSGVVIGGFGHPVVQFHWLLVEEVAHDENTSHADCQEEYDVGAP